MQDGYITRFEPDLVRADGTVPPIEQIHLHHGTWLSLPTPTAAARSSPPARRRRSPRSPRLRHADQGHRPVAAALHGPQRGRAARGRLHHLRRRLHPAGEGRGARASSPPTRCGSTCGPSATRCSTSSASFGGADGTCTWPTRAVRRLRPLRQDDRRPGRCPATAEGTDWTSRPRAASFGGRSRTSRAAPHRHRRPPAPRRARRNDIDLVRDGEPQRDLHRRGRVLGPRRPDQPGGPPTSWDFSMRSPGCPAGGSTSKPGDILRSNATYDTTIQSTYENMGIAVALLAPDDADGKPTAPGVDPFAAAASTRRPTAPRAAAGDRRRRCATRAS